MRTVILASHGHLASGMKNTVEMILGEQEALKAFDAYTTPECNVHDTLEAMLRQADGECVIVTDVLGGSVNKDDIVLQISGDDLSESIQSASESLRGACLLYTSPSPRDS